MYVYMYIQLHVSAPVLPQVGTLDTLVALSDQLQKLDPFVEKYEPVLCYMC